MNGVLKVLVMDDFLLDLGSDVIAEEGFLISPGYSLELCIQMGISFLSPLLFASLLFTAICKASSDNHFAFLHFFSMGMVLIPVSCTVS